MTFQEWMVGRFSARTRQSYYIGIKNTLSREAIEHGFTTVPLLEIRDIDVFNDVQAKLRTLPSFIERDIRGHSIYGAGLHAYEKYLSEVEDTEQCERDIAAIITDPAATETQKVQLVNARIGQGKYRDDLLKLWGACSVTGYADTSLLIASHIKPWSKSNNAERLDPYNGLLLLPNIDKVFDKGLITFESDGKIRISAHLKNPETLGLHAAMRVNLKPQQQPYMQFHRETVFKGLVKG